MATEDSEVRIVLLGKTGSGKSATGNTILGREEFFVHFLPRSVTRKCQKHEATVEGRKISVVDTPGLFDTSMPEEELKAEIEQCVKLSLPGPHVFLLVLRLGVRFTAEERNAVEWIQKNFGEEASKHTIILFTHADVLKTVSIEKYIAEDENLKNVVRGCEGRYHLFNNDDMKNRTQVLELLEKMKALSSTYYTNEMYQRIQKELQDEEERKRREEEEKRKQWEEKIRGEERKKFEEEKRELEYKCRKLEEKMQKQEEESRRKEEEIKKFEEECQKLEDKNRCLEEKMEKQKEESRRKEDERKKFEEECRKLEDKNRCLEEKMEKQKEEEKIREDERKRITESFLQPFIKIAKSFSRGANKRVTGFKEAAKGIKDVAKGAGAGAAAGTVAAGFGLAVGVAAEITLVAAAAPVALVVGPLIGAGIGWAVYRNRRRKEKKASNVSSTQK